MKIIALPHVLTRCNAFLVYLNALYSDLSCFLRPRKNVRSRLDQRPSNPENDARKLVLEVCIVSGQARVATGCIVALSAVPFTAHIVLKCTLIHYSSIPQ